jgi:hypothetical protein
MTTSHKLPSQGHNRQIMDEALRGRIETGPADAVEEEVAGAHGGDVAIGGQTFDKHRQAPQMAA